MRKTGNGNARNVLMLGNNDHDHHQCGSNSNTPARLPLTAAAPRSDYLRDLTWSGILNIYGANATEYEKLCYIYKSCFDRNHFNNMYNGGYGYTKTVNGEPPPAPLGCAALTCRVPWRHGDRPARAESRPGVLEKAD